MNRTVISMKLLETIGVLFQSFNVDLLWILKMNDADPWWAQVYASILEMHALDKL